MYVTLQNDHQKIDTVCSKVETATSRNFMDYEPGRHLYLEGDEAECLFEVVSGVLRLTRLMENGRRQVIAFGYPGDIVGFPSDGLHHTDCDVLRKARVIPHRRVHLESASHDPGLHAKLFRAALQEISAMQDHFMMLGRKSAGEKVASFFCTLADRVGEPLGNFTQFDLPMSRSDIADFLGLTTETVSRAITQLRRSKVIEIDHIYTVIVLKPDALFALGDGMD